MASETSSSKRRYDAIVIGSGPGGGAAAVEAARLGSLVALIEADRVGGCATWHSLLPSKVWLTAADRLETRAHDAHLGVEAATSGVDVANVVTRIATLSQANGERYRNEWTTMGIHPVSGHATLQIPIPYVWETRLWRRSALSSPPGRDRSFSRASSPTASPLWAAGSLVPDSST